ncbi:MAG TPA: DUF2950 domain-containing protein [bacterium]|nr:DUF2950 domain-containing protein [bacterium]
MSTLSMTNAARIGVACLLFVFAGCAKKEPPPIPPQQFASPDEAVAALLAAADPFDVAKLKVILGSDGESLIESDDPVSDKNHAEAFVAQAKAQQHIEVDSTNTSATLVVGEGNWPMPIPIVQKDGKWSFDAAAGSQEILARRIGDNELSAIQVCHGFVEAQKEYASVKHDSSLVNQYAQRVISTPGKHDGLAWQAPDGTWQGPVGEAVARFITEGYTPGQEPFHGYMFKILRGQGPDAPLGQMDFLVDGAMIGGFALVAAPAEDFVTGIKTFIVSHDGIVYEKDFGEQTLEEFKNMARYNPDSSWTPVSEGTEVAAQ